MLLGSPSTVVTRQFIRLHVTVSTIQTVVLTADVFQLEKNIFTADVLQYFYELTLYRSYSQLTFTIQMVVLTADVFQLKKIFFFLRLKNVSCEYDLLEWLKLNFASCVVHKTRSYNMFFVN